MSPESQRIVIAQCVGWTGFNPDNIPDCLQYTARRVDGKWGLIPDYLNDLNACHEFEKSLPNSLTQKYWWSLCDVTGLDQYEACRDPLLTVSATAAQRCEAFLHTIGKWKAENDA